MTKTLISSMTIIAAFAVCSSALLNASDDKKKGNSGASNASSGQQNQENQGPNTQGQGNSGQLSGNANKNQNGGKPNKVSSEKGPQKNILNSTLNKNAGYSGGIKAKLGDANFDKNGIGPIDESKHAGDKGIGWRYQKLGNDWWFWTPSGHWCYNRGGQWCIYNPSTYISLNGAKGPFYEDQQGFFTLQNGQKTYDSTIHRDGTQAAAQVTAGTLTAGTNSSASGTSADAATTAASSTGGATGTPTDAAAPSVSSTGGATGTPADAAAPSASSTGGATGTPAPATGTPADAGKGTGSSTGPTGTPSDVPGGAPSPPPN